MKPTTLTSAIAVCALSTTLATSAPQLALADEAALDEIHRKIVKKFNKVQHITSDALTQAMKDPTQASDIVLFDVREVDEHRVSHLDNATQVTPGIWTRTFMREHGERIKGKTVVFYCSVGRRSSYVASYLQDTLKKNGAKAVVNLKGGIFSWHNQKRALHTGKAQTRFVHPYNKYWGKLIERRELTRYKPDTAPLAGAVPVSD